MEFCFHDAEVISGIEKFRTDLGEDGRWMSDLLEGVKRKWIDAGIPLTDVLVMSGEPAMVSVAKSHVVFQDDDGKEIVPGVESFKAALAALTGESSLGDLDRSPFDFSLEIEGLGVWRGNASRDASGLSLSLRYLPPAPPSIKKMKYPERYVKFIHHLTEKVRIKTPSGLRENRVVRGSGLILHVGPTASGKTTAIASEIGEIATRSTGTILSYEDPIEYRFPGAMAPVRQYDVRQNISRDDENRTEAILSHLLRNNPTVVNMGEGRKRREILGMLEASTRGHLVFGTIHASNVAEALATLNSVAKGENHLVASSLSAIVAHRLVACSDGDIAPIHEILIVNNDIRKWLMESEENSISDYVARLKDHASGNDYFPWEESLKVLNAEGKIETKEALRLKKILEGR